MRVHGSSEVKAILERWSKKVNEFFSAAWLLLVSERSGNDTPCRYHPRYHGRANAALAPLTGGELA